MTKRLDFIDYTRGIAALLVLTSHVLEIYIDGWRETFKFFNLGQMGVVSFFLVSGYIIPYSLLKSKNTLHFVLGRVFRIYPLYIFVMILMFIAFRFGLYHHEGSQDYPSIFIILCHLLFAQDLIFGETGMINFVPGNWTLLIEAIWYAFFVLLFKLKLHHSITKVILLFHLFLFVLVLFSIGSGFRLPYGRLCLISVCLTGYLYYAKQHLDLPFREFMTSLIVSLSVLLFSLSITFGYFKNDTFTITCVLTSWTTGFLIFFGFGSIQIPNSLLSKMLSFLGKVSYSLYLVHPIVIYSLYPLFNGRGTWLCLALCFILPIILSGTTYKLIEKPFNIFLKNQLSHPGSHNNKP